MPFRACRRWIPRGQSHPVIMGVDMPRDGKVITAQQHRDLPPVQRVALEQIRLGRRVVPVPAGQKGAILEGWPQLRLVAADVPGAFEAGANIGILNGAPSQIIDVDLDCPEALAIADQSRSGSCQPLAQPHARPPD